MNDQQPFTRHHIVSIIRKSLSSLIVYNPDRCLQTANPTATSLKIPIYVEHAIGEWYSPVKAETGLHPRPVSAEELVPYFDTIDPSWTPTYLVTRKGELVPALYKRAEDFLKAFIERVETNSIGGGHERVLLFSHAATVIALAQALLQDQSIGRTLRVGCCTLSIFDRKSNVDGDNSIVLGGSIWEPRGELAFASFLTKGVERDWGMNDIDAIDGVVVEDRGVPGTEGEEDIVSGVQPWKASGTAKM
jgi:transcription factor C subunit 7